MVQATLNTAQTVKKTFKCYVMLISRVYYLDLSNESGYTHHWATATSAKKKKKTIKAEVYFPLLSLQQSVHNPYPLNIFL